jgi:hypothetical protein
MIHSKTQIDRFDTAHTNDYTIRLSFFIKSLMNGIPSAHTEVCNALVAGLTKYSV